MFFVTNQNLETAGTSTRSSITLIENIWLFPHRYMLNSLNSKTISPIKATLYALPVKFCHLWKIRAPLHQVEGSIKLIS